MRAQPSHLLYVQAKNVEVGDVIDGVPITHKSVHEEFVWLSTDDGRSMKLAHSYLIPVDRRTAKLKSPVGKGL